MALAIKLDRMQRENRALSYAELARLGHVSRSRVSQILNRLFVGAIEMEYPVPQGSDLMTELANCVEFCKKALV